MKERKDFQKQVDEIMDWFEFEKVRKTMHTLDWRWGPSATIPDVSELRKEARKLLKEVYDKAGETDDEYELECGGLRAECWPGGFLRLSFVVETWDTLPEGDDDTE